MAAEACEPLVCLACLAGVCEPQKGDQVENDENDDDTAGSSPGTRPEG